MRNALPDLAALPTPSVRRILAAVSLGRGAGIPILRTALRLGRAFEAEVAAAHVDGDGSEVPVQDVHGRRARMASELRDLVDATPSGEGVTQLVLLAGTPGHEIAEYAHRDGFDLVVVGGSEREPGERLLPGHTALATVRVAHCPVLFVDGRRPLDTKVKSVVLASDLRPGSARPAQIAAELAARLGSTLTVVHVSGHLSGASYGLTRAEALRRTAEADMKAHALAGELATTVVANGGNPRDVLCRRVESADVIQGVLSAAADARADLVVCGLCELARFAESRLGGICEGILRRASCSVLVGRTTPTLG